MAESRGEGRKDKGRERWGEKRLRKQINQRERTIFLISSGQEWVKLIDCVHYKRENFLISTKLGGRGGKKSLP